MHAGKWQQIWLHFVWLWRHTGFIPSSKVVGSVAFRVWPMGGIWWTEGQSIVCLFDHNRDVSWVGVGRRWTRVNLIERVSDFRHKKKHTSIECWQAIMMTRKTNKYFRAGNDSVVNFGWRIEFGVSFLCWYRGEMSQSWPSQLQWNLKFIKLKQN